MHPVAVLLYHFSRKLQGSLSTPLGAPPSVKQCVHCLTAPPSGQGSQDGVCGPVASCVLPLAHLMEERQQEWEQNVFPASHAERGRGTAAHRAAVEGVHYCHPRRGGLKSTPTQRGRAKASLFEGGVAQSADWATEGVQHWWWRECVGEGCVGTEWGVCGPLVSLTPLCSPGAFSGFW